MKKFLREVISSKSAESAKRFVTIIVSFHFIIASFTILYIASYVVFNMPKGRVDVDLLGILKDILKDDMIIITAGLGFITVENAGAALVEMFKKTPTNDVPPIPNKLDKTEK